MTADLRGLAAWEIELGVTHVAMESTGAYWKPVWNILEGNFALILANAQHVKNVPGRKTDQKDAEWLAELLQHGLLPSSFVPPRRIRDLPDLTRARASLAQESSRLASRIQKVLEDAKIKLASVASETLGKSGTAMLDAIIAGQDDAVQLANLARGLLRAKIPQLRLALEGIVREHHRFCSNVCWHNGVSSSRKSSSWTNGWNRSGEWIRNWPKRWRAGIRRPVWIELPGGGSSLRSASKWQCSLRIPSRKLGRHVPR